MKFSTSAFLAVALSAFPSATATVFEESSATETIKIQYGEKATVKVDGEVLFDESEGRRLTKNDRKLQSGYFNAIDDCDPGFSKYIFETAIVDANGAFVEPATGGMDPGGSGYAVIDHCTKETLNFGTSTTSPVELCVPDGHQIDFIFMGTGLSFDVILDHFNDQTTIGTSFSGDHLEIAGDSVSAWGTSILQGILADTNILTGNFFTGPFSFIEATDDPITLTVAVLETRIGGDTCGGETAPDPHFKTFNGDWFDFHGQCDLVLVDVPDYAHQAGLAVYIRTTVRYAYSFIETIAVKVGEDIIQVSSWGDYMINGISNAELEGATLNGLPVTREAISEKQFKFVVTLANGHHFTIKVFKDMISTHFDLPQEHNILGLLGNSKGEKLARDGITIMEDANEFGQEWQVQDLDHQLFVTVREPQFPTKCIMPDPVEREKRRLAATVSQDAAEAACSHIKDEHVRDMCIFDVISVDDLSLAAGAY